MITSAMSETVVLRALPAVRRHVADAATARPVGVRSDVGVVARRRSRPSRRRALPPSRRCRPTLRPRISPMTPSTRSPTRSPTTPPSRPPTSRLVRRAYHAKPAAASRRASLTTISERSTRGRGSRKGTAAFAFVPTRSPARQNQAIRRRRAEMTASCVPVRGPSRPAPRSTTSIDPISRRAPLGLPCQVRDADLWFAETPAELELAKSLCDDCPARRPACSARSSGVSRAGSGAVRSSSAARSSPASARAGVRARTTGSPPSASANLHPTARPAPSRGSQ